ncbi:chromosome replication/partitioning protein (plasmid) [Borrelia miyamotoi]|uniref:Chromosome replication/partitioning protein n=1 Tax=Borrelia miyamotoi TaxID=47466 RepID=A0AAX3JNN0_9SPIR|nr:chromosome replication/partitioning protein [Borrelia miyamotoi]WAZ72507.1 chromosome replication/partitioning protein [Borrelia miyamotoi]WVI05369.1 chromosome replication/partitioning protein [Borrelia miyamotoi]
MLDKNNENQRKEEFDQLVKQLKNNIKSEIYNIIDTMKILKKINDNKLYVEGGFNSFKDFLTELKLAKTQSYEYIKLATAIETGLLEEDFITLHGIRASIRYIKTKTNGIIKKSRQNPINPLRFQLKSQMSYDFYKKNTKPTGFILDKLCSDKKDWLEDFIKELKSVKGEK